MEDQKNPKYNYEDKAKEIDVEIKKRRGKWFLDSLAWFDFEDVEQIIKAHIHKKWDQWDQRRSLKPWINKIITNQHIFFKILFNVNIYEYFFILLIKIIFKFNLIYLYK